MSGLRKAKKYDWKDSNMALFGSDTDKAVKKESAETEKAWHGCGEKVGLKIWRVVQFKIETWPEEDYGKFYDGDSYIILNTYEQDDKLMFDVHFWIGRYSTQDEYGTAAYKTVELDTYLDDKPVQHREVQGHESKMFKSYFKTMTILQGGADTGFKRVPVEQYQPRLLKFQKLKNKKVQMTEHKRRRSELNDSDVFILDNGLELIQWNGANCNQMEKWEAAQQLNKLKDERVSKGKVHTRIYDGDLPENHRFWNYFTDDGDDDDDDDDDAQLMQQQDLPGGYNLVRVTDDDGSIGMEEVPPEGERQLCGNDVFLIHTLEHLYVWVGKEASVDERRNGMSYGHQYLSGKGCNFLSISVIPQGSETKDFNQDVKIDVAPSA